MKLYELFWPADMRKQVTRLREEGNLNKGALKYIFASQCYIIFLLFLVFLLLVLLAPPPEPWLYLLGFFLLIITLYYTMRKVYLGEILPFTIGEKTKTPNFEIIYGMVQPGSAISWRVEYWIGSKFRRFVGLTEEEKESLEIHNGQLTLLVVPGSHYSAPYIPLRFSKCCLDSSKER
tara:strand:+ start:676 stop:1206 length:531 start_codon:yes stop_codon:yes gene_type:complete